MPAITKDEVLRNLGHIAEELGKAQSSASMVNRLKSVAEYITEAVEPPVVTVNKELLALLVESQDSIGGDWRARRDAAVSRAQATPSEVGAAIELPERPWGEDMAAWLEARDDSEIDDEITAYATEAVLKDRATLKAQTK